MFGVDAVTVAAFEHRVKFSDGSQVHCVIIGFHARENGALGDRALPCGIDVPGIRAVGADHWAARIGDRALPCGIDVPGIRAVGADHRAARKKAIYDSDGTAIPAALLFKLYAEKVARNGVLESED